MPCTDTDKKKERAADLVTEKLFESRTVLICGEINQKLARDITAQLLALSVDSDEDIVLYINSQGGHVEAGDTIHDVVKFIKPRVIMVGTGWVASAGAHIFLSAPTEDRLCLPNTRFLLHQPSGGAFGRAIDIDIEAQEIIKMRERLNQVIADATGQPIEKVREDTDRNFWLSAEEAKDYGIVGRIVKSQTDIAG